MAKGRMINNTIVFDAKIHRLSCDTSRLAFTWLVSFADVEGRTYGDPAIVRSLLFPRRSDVTIDDVAEYIQEWHDQELIILYTAKDDIWIQFINFEKNQVGMRKDREAPTNIPAPPLRSKSGVSPELVPLNRTEQNRTEQKESCGEIFKKYENNIAMLTESSQKTIGGWIDNYPRDWIPDAIDIAVNQNKRKPAYIAGILKNWKENGKDSKPKPPSEKAAAVY